MQFQNYIVYNKFDTYVFTYTYNKLSLLNIYLWVLTFPLEDCSEFSNFAITLIISKHFD